MKNGKPMREVQTEYRETVKGLCLVCEKPCFAFYGNYSNSGVCNKTCMKIYEKINTNADIRVYKKG